MIREYIPQRFVSSMPRHMAPLDSMTGDSLDWVFRPGSATQERKCMRRLGQPTVSGWDSPLFASWSSPKPRGRQIVGMRAGTYLANTTITAQLADKSQHPTVLFTDDTDGAKRGEVVTYDSTNTDWYSLGQEYGMVHYPIATGSYGGTVSSGGGSSITYRWVPLWTNGTSSARYMRGITAANRQAILAGGRSIIEAGEWLYGMSDGSPWMWRKTWNFSAAVNATVTFTTHTNTTMDTGTTSALTVGMWVSGSGITPGTKIASITNGTTLVLSHAATSSTTGSFTFFGPNINRLRPWGHQVPLWHSTATASGGTSSVKSWRKNRVFYYAWAFKFEDGSIGPFTPISDSVADAGTNGTRGRYTIPNASDYYAYIRFTLIPRGPKGCVGRILARTAQVDSTTGFQPTFPGQKDLRVVVEISNNTQTTYDLYEGDDEVLIATPDIVRIDHKWPSRGKYIVANDNRFLMCGSIKPNPAAIIIAPTGITATRDINTYGLTGSITAYIDDPDSQRVDEYLSSPGTRGFYVELQGGRLDLHYHDGTTTSTSSIDTNPTTNYITLQALVDLINTTVVGGSGKEWAAQLAPGVDGETLTSSLAATTNSAAVGDAGRGSAGTADHIWVRHSSEPIVLYFSKAYMDSFPADDQAIEFTKGGPSDTPSAILNWSPSGAQRRKPGDAFVGRCLGAAPLRKSFVVFYERGIYRLEPNEQLVADDEHMRLVPILVGNVHVVSDSSICWGNGFVGCMTHEGFLAIDEKGYQYISGGIYSHEKQTGEWLNEIGRSLKATQNGGMTAGGDEPFLYCAVMGHQIHVTYRKSATAANDRRMIYDYSHNEEVEGLPALKGGSWSCPLTNTVGVMAEIADQSGGMVRYGVVENNAQGRIDKFDSGTVDGASTAVTATGYLPTDFCDTAQLKAAKQLTVIYDAPGTGLAVVFARDQGSAASTHSTDTYSTSLATTGSALYTRKVIDLSPEARAPADVFEVKVTDTGNGNPPDIWRIALEYDRTEFPR